MTAHVKWKFNYYYIWNHLIILKIDKLEITITKECSLLDFKIVNIGTTKTLFF